MYSLRAFSRDIGVPASNLSNVLRGERALSAPTVVKVCEALGVSLQDVVNVPKSTQTALGLDTFVLIRNWIHFAILALTHVKNFKLTAKSIHSRFGIEPSEAQSALDLMVRLKILRRNKGCFESEKNFQVNTEDVPSLAVRDFHQELLTQASRALYESPLEDREFRSIVAPIRIEDVPEIKKWMKEIHNEFENKFGRYEKNDGDKVYSFSMQFYSPEKRS